MSVGTINNNQNISQGFGKAQLQRKAFITCDGRIRVYGGDGKPVEVAYFTSQAAQNGRRYRVCFVGEEGIDFQFSHGRSPMERLREWFYMIMVALEAKGFSRSEDGWLPASQEDTPFTEEQILEFRDSFKKFFYLQRVSDYETLLTQTPSCLHLDEVFNSKNIWDLDPLPDYVDFFAGYPEAVDKFPTFFIQLVLHVEDRVDTLRHHKIQKPLNKGTLAKAEECFKKLEVLAEERYPGRTACERDSIKLSVLCSEFLEEIFSKQEDKDLLYLLSRLRFTGKLSHEDERMLNKDGNRNRHRLESIFSRLFEPSEGTGYSNKLTEKHSGLGSRDGGFIQDRLIYNHKVSDSKESASLLENLSKIFLLYGNKLGVGGITHYGWLLSQEHFILEKAIEAQEARQQEGRQASPSIAA